MGLLRFLADHRNRQIVAHAEPYLEAGEEIVDWVRARHTDKRRDGFAYLTDRHLIVHWTGRNDGHGAVPWQDIQTWAVNPQARGGPILAFETAAQQHYVQMPVRTLGMAQSVKGFISGFARKAPTPNRRLTTDKTGFQPLAEVEVGLAPRSLFEHTRRVAITVLGITLLVVALVIVPLPGPWSILLAVAGLAVLASEYDWAKDALVWTKDRSRQAIQKLRQRRAG